MNTNLARLKDIALVLGEIKDQVVFVGGATVSLYIDDQAAPLPQPSEDVDCVVEIATYNEWCEFEKNLRQKGFQDSDFSGEDINPPTCRKYLLGMKVDFMPIEETVLGYGNPWFKNGVQNSIIKSIDDIEIKVFKLEHLIATKLNAFNDRGLKGDIRLSQDLEDLTELLDGCTKFEETVNTAENQVKKFIINELKKFKLNSDFREAMYGFMAYDDNPTKEARLNRVFAIIDRLIS